MSAQALILEARSRMDDRNNTYRTTLQYAIAIAGSVWHLAAQLRVAKAQIDNWLAGIDAIPDHVFSAAVEVIVKASPEAIARGRTFLDKGGIPTSH